jgi:hypothetical protein
MPHIVSTNNLRSGAVQSCGCLHREIAGQHLVKHGMSNMPEHTIWLSMHQRCYDSHVQSFPRYGGRGITVCERWHDFQNFIADMGTRPTKNHSLERRNNDLGYSPENCRWATRIEQARNTRTNHFITIRDRTACVAEWLEIVGMKKTTFYARMHKGWNAEEALMTPIDTLHSHKKPT